MFDDLSGVELRRRLEQRGVDEERIESLIDHRENCPICRSMIEEALLA